jgi:hypothetical protein
MYIFKERGTFILQSFLLVYIHLCILEDFYTAEPGNVAIWGYDNTLKFRILSDSCFLSLCLL